MNKELIKFLQEKQIAGNWLSIANTYNVSGTTKQKSDYVRRQWKKVQKESTGTVKSDEPVGIHIVIGCAHVPFHNKKLLNNLLTFISDYKSKIVGFHIIGDFLDMRSLCSMEDKVVNSTGLSLGKEYSEGNKVLNLIESYLPPNIQKTYIWGNHEAWYTKFVTNIKNYKTADAIQSPTQALKLKERGYTVLEDWREDYVNVGKYQLFHGVFCTQTPAKSHITKLKHSCIFAHTHRIDEYYEKDLHGLNIGTMCDMESEGFKYLSRLERTSWKNGFGIIHVENNQSQAAVIVCEKNSFFYGGKKYYEKN